MIGGLSEQVNMQKGSFQTGMVSDQRMVLGDRVVY